MNTNTITAPLHMAMDFHLGTVASQKGHQAQSSTGDGTGKREVGLFQHALAELLGSHWSVSQLYLCSESLFGSLQSSKRQFLS